MAETETLDLDALDKVLIGRTLDERWRIESKRDVVRDAASRSRSYVARAPNGDPVFVKVLDPSGQGSLAAQQIALDDFAYESQIVERCGDRKMRRVVRGLASGSVLVDGPIPIHVRYLVFEWANSDVRSQLDLDDRSHLAACLRWLHHAATALQELHFSKIAHQDLKPANVLVLSSKAAKIGDLGRAHDHENPRPHGDNRPDPTWAPLKLLYGKGIGSFDERCAADMYQLGSLAVFLFSSAGLTLRNWRAGLRARKDGGRTKTYAWLCERARECTRNTRLGIGRSQEGTKAPSTLAIGSN